MYGQTCSKRLPIGRKKNGLLIDIAFPKSSYANISGMEMCFYTDFETDTFTGTFYIHAVYIDLFNSFIILFVLSCSEASMTWRCMFV